MKQTELVELMVGKVKELGEEEENTKLEELGKKEMDSILKMYGAVVNDGLVNGDEIPVPGVGKFSTVERAERESLKTPGKPKDGKKKVPAHTAPKFKFGKSIKEAVK
jgi:DNA-binding protein HU-beta